MAEKNTGELFSEIIGLNKEELEILAAAVREKLDVSSKDRTANVSAEKYDPFPDPDPGYKIILTECGQNKLQVIKLIRIFSYRSLKDARDCAEHLPAIIDDHCPDKDAFSIKKEFEDAGAAVQLERVWS